VVSPDGGSAWALGPDGVVVQLGPGSEPAAIGTRWNPPAPAFEDIAISVDGRTLYGLVAATDGRTTALVSFDAAPPWRETSRHEVKGRGSFLEITRDGLACIVGIKTSPGVPREAGGWVLTVIDARSGAVAGPVRLGLSPQAVALVDPPGSAPRLIIAASGRIISYNLDPPRASWFYKSPGDHSALAGSRTGSILCALRGTALAVIDPSRRPRSEGRAQLTDDDATTLVPLPAAARGLALSPDGSVAAVLHEDRSALSLIDVAAASVVRTEPLPGAPGLIASRMIERQEETLLVAVASSTPDAGPGISLVQVPRTVPASPPAVAAEPAAEPEREPTVEPESTEQSEPPAVAPPQVPPPAPGPTRTVDEASLTGKISGQREAAREVLFYGPNNILKLHARAAISADGNYSMTLPPPGSYRVVVKGEPGKHLFTRPEFRTVVVSAGGGIAGIDFEVRGSL
jgi:hypothetical protein